MDRALSAGLERLLTVLASAASLFFPVQSHAQVGGLESEIVPLEELIVTAPLGPPWWKVSRGDSVVYILASPGWLPSGLDFDRQRLERRLSGANSLILSPRWTENAFPPNVVAKTLSAKTTGAPETFLDGPIRARYIAARDRLKVPDDQMAGMSPALAGMILAGEVESKRLPLSGQSLDSIVWAIAKQKRVRVIRPAHLYGRRDADKFLTDLKRPGLTCLTSSLEYVEQPQSGDFSSRDAAAAAWARGDIRPLLDRARESISDRHLFMRHNIGGRTIAIRASAPDCTSAMPSVLAMSQRWIPDQADAVEAALSKPGHSVAVFDPVPLVTKGGVLDLLRQKGYAVATPDIQ